jgi:type IV pilus assembly protein PilC
VLRNRSALPREASAYLAAGSTPAAQHAAIRELSRSQHSELAAIWRTCVDRFSYLIAVMTFMAGVLTFLMIKIVPEFEKIFAEFQVDLPAMTQLAIALSEFTVRYWILPLFLFTVLALIAAIVVGILYLCDIRVFSWLGGILLPGRRRADILQILAVATEQRQPIAQVFEHAAAVYPSVLFRRRLHRTAAATSAGQNWQDALVASRIVSQAEGSLLKTAQEAGNLPWALRAIAARREKRDVYRLAGWLHILYPAAILAIGSLVAFYVISLFIPLVSLINGLSR